MKMTKRKEQLEKNVPYGTKEAVVQNLKDAGCRQEMIDRFMECLDKEEPKQQLQLLEQHRNYLLNVVHEKEKQIECLDYLVYQIKRNKGGNRT